VGAGGGIDGEPVSWRHHLGPAADGELHRTGVEQPAGDRGSGCVGGTANHRQVGTNRDVLRGRSGQDAANLDRLPDGRQEIEAQVERIEEVPGPVVRRHVIKQRAGGVAGLGRGFVDES
jgi:hypothetical protein